VLHTKGAMGGCTLAKRSTNNLGICPGICKCGRAYEGLQQQATQAQGASRKAEPCCRHDDAGLHKDVAAECKHPGAHSLQEPACSRDGTGSILDCKRQHWPQIQRSANVNMVIAGHQTHSGRDGITTRSAIGTSKSERLQRAHLLPNGLSSAACRMG
jgi:hypothetical protein